MFFDLFSQSVTDSTLLRLLLAALLGGIIGFERDIHGRAAGLRTNLLISLGSAVFMLISVHMTDAIISPAASVATIDYRSDPGRIAAQIVTGIGFLGAGTIVKYGFSVRGLTTAACIWISSAIGMGAGAGFFELAILTTIIGLFCLVVLNFVEKKYAKDTYRVLKIETNNDSNVSVIIDAVKRKEIKILYVDLKRNFETNRLDVSMTLRLHCKGATDKLAFVILQDLEHSSVTLHKASWIHQ